MDTLNVTQGSHEWHAARAAHFCASEAPAMMGLSPYVTRSQLLREKKTGDTKPIDSFTQALFDRGHEIEAFARTLAESDIGEDLYPTTAILTVDGLPLLASFDGLTADDSMVFECKTANTANVRAVKSGQVPEQYWPQLEQQLLVSGAEAVRFTVSDGTAEGTHWCLYLSDPQRRADLLAGWKQFAADLESWQPQVIEAAPVAAPIKQLPALMVRLVGEVRESNLVEYKGTLLAMVAGINTDLQTDQDFADAENMVKFCDKAEKELELTKKAALEQTMDIAELFRAVDELRDAMRAKRLQLDKLVKTRKDAIRGEILARGTAAVGEHIRALNQRLGAPLMPSVPHDFASAMRSKRTVDSLNSAVDDEIARFKIAASAIADTIQGNVTMLTERAGEYATLFPDRAQIVLKAPDDLASLIEYRINAHKVAEAKRAEDARIAAERKAEAARIASTQATPAHAPEATPVVAAPSERLRSIPSAIVTPMPSPSHMERVDLLYEMARGMTGDELDAVIEFARNLLMRPAA